MGVWSQAPDLAADRFPGGVWVIQDGFNRDLYFGHVKKTGIDWSLAGRFGSVVHLPFDDLRQVLGGDTNRSSCTETINTTRPDSPNVSATRGNLEAK